MAEKRNPRTSATVDQLLTRYLDQFDGAPNTLTNYRGYMRNHVSPLIGKVKVGALDAEVLDSFHTELRRCRQHCSGQGRRAALDPRQEHECDRRCTRPHACRPLGASVVRHIHFLLSGAFERAVRWRWVGVNPVSLATPPAAPKPEPAAAFATRGGPDGRGVVARSRLGSARLDGDDDRRPPRRAVRDPPALCRPRRGRESLWLRHAIRNEYGRLVEAELKTHQQQLEVIGRGQFRVPLALD